MRNWESTTKSELTTLIEKQLADCSALQKAIFEKNRVPLQKCSISRHGKNEAVFVVAIKNGEALYYEDVEEGFNFSPLNDDGSIKEHWCNQNELKTALSHWQ